MATRYVTKHGEMIDAVCRRHYGDESGYVEQVLEANRGLAGLPVVLPAGTVVMLPKIAKAAETVKLVALWD